MISLEVRCVCGHYRIPTVVSDMTRTPSFPVAPPSTIKGFIEALVGKVGAMEENRFAYGLASDPTGMGYLLRKDTVWTTSGADVKVPSWNKKGEARSEPDGSIKMINGKAPVSRPTMRETHFHLTYRVVVEGPLEDALRASLTEPSGGGRYLGESDNPIWWLEEGTPATRWIVPGSSMPLPLKSGYGFNSISPVYRGWDFSNPSEEIPKEAWIEQDADH